MGAETSFLANAANATLDKYEADKQAAIPVFVEAAKAIDAYFTLPVETGGQLTAAIAALANTANARDVTTKLAPLVGDCKSVTVEDRADSFSINMEIPCHWDGRLADRDGLLRGRIADAERIAFTQKIIDAASGLQDANITVSQIPGRAGRRETIATPGEHPGIVHISWA